MTFIFQKLLLAFIALASMASSYKIPTRDYQNNNYFIMELDTSQGSQILHDFINEHKEVYSFQHQLYGFDDHFVFSINKSHPFNQILGHYNSNTHTHDESNDNDGIDSFKLLKRSPEYADHYDSLVNSVRSIHALTPKKLSKRLPVPVSSPPSANTKRTVKIVDSSQEPIRAASEKLDINDPNFVEQWHLINSQYPGHDVNVTGLWYENIFGEGITSAIVDDGLDYESEDLRDNFNAKGSWDFNSNTNLPKPRLYDDYHGTRCAGEIAAVKNGACGVGVSYKSKVSGIRILSGSITASEEAAALIYGLDVNDIYSCSWGPTDDGKTLSAPELIVKQAMVKGVQHGRKDKGAVYVFASGNGGRNSDSCNFDGYTNSIFSITVGAIDYKGLHPAYSEACSAVMVVTYSSGSGEHIHTTDFHDKCTAIHGGTSAAAPLAAGIYSLVLSVNPNLTWRDVQYVSALSAVPVNEDDGNYQMTALGRKYSHKYGYGKIDAYAIVKFAQQWQNVKPQTWYYSDVAEVNEEISKQVADDNKVIKNVINVSKDDLKLLNFDKVEHVTVTVNIESTFRGSVGVRLISPFGVISDLATFRPYDTSNRGFKEWTFMSVAHWGEIGEGDWTIEVFSDQTNQQNEIKFKNWQLRLFGASLDADKAEEYDITKDYAAVRRDKIKEQQNGGAKQTSTAVDANKSTSTGVSRTATATTNDKAKTTPTGQAPGGEGKVEEGTKTSTSSSSSSTSSKPTASGTEEDEDDSGKNKQYTADHTGQYFMGIAVVGFIVVILLMRFHKTPGSSRRRRREEYEFDIIPGEDYTDSDDSHNEDDDDDDSLDLGHRNDARAPLNDDRSKQTNKGQKNPRNSDEARDRLFEDFNAETLPDYDDDMFIIDDGDEEEGHDHRAGGKKGSSKKENIAKQESNKTEGV